MYSLFIYIVYTETCNQTFEIGGILWAGHNLFIVCPLYLKQEILHAAYALITIKSWNWVNMAYGPHI